MKGLKAYLVVLITVGLMLSVAIGPLAMAEIPSGANTNSVEMSLTGLPITQRPGENVTYSIQVSNPQTIPPFYSADATNITVTFYPAQADGNPSPTGTIVGTITYLAVNATVTIGPLTYPMPALNPLVPAAKSRAVLNGTILLGTDPAGLPFDITKEVSIALQSEPPVGGTAFSVNKLWLVAPFAVLLGGATVVILLMLRKRRQA